MKLNKLILTAFAGALFFASCSSDDDSSNAPKGAYDNGLLILNQGGYNVGNASISFLSEANELENNVFSLVNGGLLGDTGQDIGLHGDYAYIVVNNSHKIEIVNRYTFEGVATVTTGLDNPRYIAFSGDKGYVTNWGDPVDTTDDYVAVLDLSTNTVSSSIEVVEGPEAIVENNGNLYVAHKGGYGYGNTVTVINAAAGNVTTSIAVGDVPNSLEIDNGKLYVMGEGAPSWSGTETTGQLTVINLTDNSISQNLVFNGITHPTNLVIENNKLYYTINDGIYTMTTSATTLPSAPLFTTTEQGVYGVYSFEVKNNKVYVGDAMDYNSNGKVYIYSLTGEKLEEFTVGVIPAGFYFN
ncbi:hypothetical protein DVK85_13080 [Flavobacterium arcticum]|uniref:YncE family protein n=1 Tax=Flavobacterium arcticum TaxID=1784713 RepID=A0A345HEV2_9FLAO|nr:DUF5074 domain-containing protein [Flavobacterium arcticum]AXG75112.1 hypothetical protein DVK85_13080 [Flavobacterium arcticum]KAF2511108.1 hypothetical protein E0W72_06865 [Flavobacterium arcticum]